MKYMVTRRLMNADDMARTIRRLASEIQEWMPDTSSLVLVGIQTRGVPLAERLKELLPGADTGILDITFYRDDLTIVAESPMVKETRITGSLDGRTVLLVDDVLFTGRTIRAAMDNLLDYGRPAAIRLAVLVGRGYRALPIRADFVGRRVDTEREELVDVRLREVDGEDAILVLRKEGE